MADDEKTVRLVPREETAMQGVARLLNNALTSHDEQGFTAVAVAMVRNDGITFVGTSAIGNRALLLGAVTDLQYTIAKDGDPKS